ncbi:MAG TPA: signal recognition particle-docking protein FtsY [Lachnospiraceae bacterium]|nr:signal recognition particle-docking protein FtsY [Lachnospiraceae bacterium]
MFDFFKKKKKDEEVEEKLDESLQSEQMTSEEQEVSDSMNAGERAEYSESDVDSSKMENMQEASDAGNSITENEESDVTDVEVSGNFDSDDVDTDRTEESAEEPAEEEFVEEETTEEEAPAEKEKGFFARLKEGLTKTRNSINESFNQLFSGFSSIDEDFYDELEETLIMADLGLDTTERIIDNLKDMVKKNHIKEVEACRELVVNIIKEQMLVEDSAYDFEDQKTVMLIIGVNGVGKTTSIGKLAAQYKKRGKRVMMCAADTFRAAAIDQLKTWANRAGVEIISQQEGSDPAAVTYDAVKAAAARDVDILLVDTAGRLHNKKNLMDELAKMKRIIEKEYGDAHLETLIVLDGSTGQNALEQARQFSTVTKIDGIILTKLDGTAKGGIAIAIQSELSVPVKYIGVGEQIDDLQKFDPESYVNALFADMDTRSDIEILVPDEE